MSVISAIITRYGTVHASDSLLTVLQSDGTHVPAEWEKSKIVRVPKLRGAMAYWGLARYEDWSTLEWLQDQANKAKDFDLPEEFANHVKNKLNESFSAMNFHEPLDSGIGIHFTAYKCFDDYWIPELFLLTNYTDTSYSAVHWDGVHLSRETYGTMMTYLERKHIPPRPEHREAEFRLAVHRHLQEGGMLTYNNGDPVMFNNAARGISMMLRELSLRRNLIQSGNIEIYQQMVRTPIEVVSNIQKKFAREGTRLVGGKIHDLSITPQGEYKSTSGD